MKILIALNHPAHYYLFKYISRGLREKGNKVEFVIREKDILEQLLVSEGVTFTKLSKKRKRKKNSLSIISRLTIELFEQDMNLLKFVNKFHPDIMLGTDIAITHIGRFKRIPSIVFNEDDYEINKLFCKTSYPFSTHIFAPYNCSVGKHTKKKIPYNGYQKMAYLNKKYFNPDKKILNEFGITEQRYFIIRIVSLTSGHDLVEGKHRGINFDLLRKVINKLTPYGKIYLNSEDSLPAEFQKYQLKIVPNKMHHIMAFASLFIGDSQTMCAEAGILGTPFIRFNDFVGKIEYLNDLENKYNLGFGIKTSEPEKLLNIIEFIISKENLKEEWREKVKRLFEEKIDLTSLVIWFVNNYPNSAEILKTNPDYQLNFK